MFRENSTETCILSIVKQITSPGWMHETSARGWCTGKTQRDWVEREMGGGSGWGIHVNPWWIHVNVWQKPLQYYKVISLQLIKINGKKNYICNNPTSKESHILRYWESGFQLIFMVAQVVKNFPEMWENQVQSLGWEDPLEKGMATHSSILTWEISWTEEPSGL